MEFLILFALIILNGLFALSELAIVSARKARLQLRVEGGSQGAAIAIKLAEAPNHFLSTVQIGITLIGIGAGVFGGSALTQDITDFIRANSAFLSPYANQISYFLIISLTTYLSLVIGELVPKRIALHNPERIAVWVARPMLYLSYLTAPLVWLLSQSTGLVTFLLGLRGEGNNSMSDYEIMALIEEGIETGVFDSQEHRMVQGIFELDAMRLREIITPRTEIIWLDSHEDSASLRQKLSQYQHSAYPVCHEALDNVIGVVRSKDILRQILNGEDINLQKIMLSPLFVPESAIVAKVLQDLKMQTLNMAMVVGEHGGIEGIVTITDIIEEVVGDVDMADPRVIQREDGSWLIDGDFPVDKLADVLLDFAAPENEESVYTTLAGFALARFSKIPKVAEKFMWKNYEFEVMDMDGQRIDKILVNLITDES